MGGYHLCQKATKYRRKLKLLVCCHVSLCACFSIVYLSKALLISRLGDNRTILEPSDFINVLSRLRQNAMTSLLPGDLRFSIHFSQIALFLRIIFLSLQVCLYWN